MGLSIRNLSKSFNGTNRETLQNISLDIEQGEFICVVGPSGCGKSTLLNLIAGLEEPTSGSIKIDGEEVKGPGADRIVMFQEAALFPWLTVMENVRFGMELAKMDKAEQERRAERYLKMVQLYHFKDYPIHQLSGGMKQRTSLARALALDSKVLLMDEPFSALDKQTINILRNELQDIWMKTKKTIFFITHSVEEAVFFADRIIVLSDNPGTIKHIYEMNLPRPRQIDTPEFVKIRKEILSLVQREVEKVAEEEYDKES